MLHCSETETWKQYELDKRNYKRGKIFQIKLWGFCYCKFITPDGAIFMRFISNRYQIQKNHMQYRQNKEFSAKLAGASAESVNESSQHVFSIL